ncbi:response regulator transcription factor [Streptomyces ipomoeae]|uniref:Response regulator receiver domain protein n=2 Tax=Streptomyces ipomoeae TaxID=103232 RepID=L1L7H4_9ACTN|nr:response regulator transcription factor [Streptomyces ipomoeae]EKX68847.1 response regulator receiver domain protein [Streptomyces ipomoeae 91-03]MDX2695048.1 response regulator transcription factor [Streptomyces ipomoeae]MDX2822620.1 response regulator transcription factor [Streptomyces ipomoeae]MDX2840926.1 response regulator transcription factor [Streptomyces ipomoeae]MDX2875225.1 response regulator transcription factor [Streptomyces ipomoeae]
MTSENSARPVRVLLADDERLLRAGLRLVLAHADDIDVVAEAADGAEAVDLAVRHRVDVVLMDIRMPGTDGLTAAEMLASRAPSVRVVMLTTFGEAEYVTRALAAGAAGFVLKDTGPQELIQAVRVAASGDAILSPRVTRDLIEEYVITNARRADEARRLVGLLTERERDVLVLIGQGLSNAEVGRRLYLGEGTVKTHVRHILAKLDCANRVQAAILAHEAGLLPAS